MRRGLGVWEEQRGEWIDEGQGEERGMRGVREREEEMEFQMREKVLERGR